MDVTDEKQKKKFYALMEVSRFVSAKKTIEKLVNKDGNTIDFNIYSNWDKEDWMRKLGEEDGPSIFAMVKKIVQKEKKSKYKSRAVFTTNQRLLDGIAKSLYQVYEFQTRHDTPSMDDVFFALSRNLWTIRKTRKGKELIDKKMSEYFDDAEWDVLEEMYFFLIKGDTANLDGILPTDSRGKFIVISDAEYNEKRVDTLQHLTAKAGLVSNPKELTVKNEKNMSSEFDDQKNDYYTVG